MLILGIDPGLGLMGFAYLNVDTTGGPGAAIATAQDYGVIETPKEATTARRLCIIEADMAELLKRATPDALAIEKFIPNPRLAYNAPPVLQARGIVLLLAEKAGIPIYEYEPSKIKLNVAGHGTATKRDVQEAVTDVLGLEETPRPDDAADGLAIAYCHWLHVEAGLA